MRGMRGALWALGLAGAAYAWKNRNKLQQQANSFGRPSAPGQLPDYGNNSGSQFPAASPAVTNGGQSQATRYPAELDSGGTNV